MAEDIKTLAIVLRRTNYSEADRILNLITQGEDIGDCKGGAKGAFETGGRRRDVLPVRAGDTPGPV